VKKWAATPRVIIIVTLAMLKASTLAVSHTVGDGSITASWNQGQAPQEAGERDNPH